MNSSCINVFKHFTNWKIEVLVKSVCGSLNKAVLTAAVWLLSVATVCSKSAGKEETLMEIQHYPSTGLYILLAVN
jgi:hypothetical protein